MGIIMYTVSRTSNRWKESTLFPSQVDNLLRALNFTQSIVLQRQQNTTLNSSFFLFFRADAPIFQMYRSFSRHIYYEKHQKYQCQILIHQNSNIIFLIWIQNKRLS